jgi:hypothetical protein
VALSRQDEICARKIGRTFGSSAGTSIAQMMKFRCGQPNEHLQICA